MTAQGKKPNIYAYKTLSVDHLKQLQHDIDTLDHEGKLSDHEIYRKYIGTKKFEIPENFPDARSIIIIAVFTRLMLLNFHLYNKKYRIMVPPLYYDDGISDEMLTDTVSRDIIQESGYKIQKAQRLHLKLTAVRSGLGVYGRNNLCYVHNMGSLLALYAYFTDYDFAVDNWKEIKMMETCRDCRICATQCPCSCISEENFVINAGKCLTLYNEIPGEFPAWLNPESHNALVGCMKCQMTCPANHDVITQTGMLDDITEEETLQILNGSPDEKVLHSIWRKLRMPSPDALKEFFPVLTRNLNVLLKPHD